MKGRLIELLSLTMMIACLTACGSPVSKAIEEQSEVVVEEAPEVQDTEVVKEFEPQVYEIETFDGEILKIDDSNIISQFVVASPLEWIDLPTNAEQIAPGRQVVVFEYGDHYYVEDANNGIVTVAQKTK